MKRWHCRASVGAFVLTVCASLFGACARQDGAQTESRRSNADLLQCLQQKEAEWVASGKLRAGFKCGIGGGSYSDRVDVSPLCTEELPRACDAAPEQAQQAFMDGSPTCAMTRLGDRATERETCMARKQEQYWANGSLPRRLAFNCQLFGNADLSLLERKSQEALQECESEIRRGKTDASQGTRGSYVKPACASDDRVQYNADCSAVRTSQGVFRLGPVLMCQGRKEVELKRPGGLFNFYGYKWDCGSQAGFYRRFEPSSVCESISNECVAEVGLPAHSVKVYHHWQVGGPNDPLPPPLNGASPWTGHPGGIPEGVSQAQTRTGMGHTQPQPQTEAGSGEQAQAAAVGSSRGVRWCNATALRSCMNAGGGSGCLDLNRPLRECSTASGFDRLLEVQFDVAKACMTTGSKTNAQKIACVPGL